MDEKGRKRETACYGRDGPFVVALSERGRARKGSF